jgi:hypothetical protein
VRQVGYLLEFYQDARSTKHTIRIRNVCAIVSRTNSYASRVVFKYRLLASRLPEVHKTMGVDVTVFWIVIAVRLAVRIREVTTKKIILRRRANYVQDTTKSPHR